MVVLEVTVAVGVPVVRIMVAEATETQGRVAMEIQGQVALEILILTGAMGEIDYSRNVLATILAGVAVFYQMHDASLTIQQINGTCHHVTWVCLVQTRPVVFGHRRGTPVFCRRVTTR